METASQEQACGSFWWSSATEESRLTWVRVFLLEMLQGVQKTTVTVTNSLQQNATWNFTLKMIFFHDQQSSCCGIKQSRIWRYCYPLDIYLLYISCVSWVWNWSTVLCKNGFTAWMTNADDQCPLFPQKQLRYYDKITIKWWSMITKIGWKIFSAILRDL